MKAKYDYNDGIAEIYKEIPKVNDFGAAKNIKNKDDLEPIVNLAFKECSKRISDIEVAEVIGNQLTIKLKTRLYESVDKGYKVIVKKTIYNIFELDFDRANQEMYLYLEEVRKLA